MENSELTLLQPSAVFSQQTQGRYGALSAAGRPYQSILFSPSSTRAVQPSAADTSSLVSSNSATVRGSRNGRMQLSPPGPSETATISPISLLASTPNCAWSPSSALA